MSLALMLGGCRNPSEEERLRERVNVSGTHFYVAFKLALSEHASNPDVKRLKPLLAQFEQGLAKTRQEGADKNLLTVENVRAATDITVALWGLREEGRTEVEKWRESDLALLGPAWDQHELGPYSKATEHAVLLLGLIAMSLHPQAPAPVPSTAVLYEAYLLGDQPVVWPEVDGLARSAQAITYAGEQYCEMAATSTARLVQLPLKVNESQLASLGGWVVGLGRAAAHAPEAAVVLAAAVLAQQLPWALRMLAYARTAQCLGNSDLPDAKQRALMEWERAVGVAEQVGFPAPELAFLRAYLAYRRSDFGRVQSELSVARQSTLLTPGERLELDELVEHFDPNSRGALDAFLDPLFISSWVVRLVHHRLQAVGFYEQLRRIPVFDVVTTVFESATLPTQETAKAAGNQVWHWLTERFRAWRGG